MKTEKQFQQWAEEQIKFYQPILGFQLQRIDFEKSKEKNPDFGLKIDCSYPYLDPTINYSQDGFERWREGKMHSDSILHELLHFITDPLYVKALSRWLTRPEVEDERERLTDVLAVIIRNLIEKPK